MTSSGRNGRGRFITGNSGGPGRPKGSRNRLGEDFLRAASVASPRPEATCVPTKPRSRLLSLLLSSQVAVWCYEGATTLSGLLVGERVQIQHRLGDAFCPLAIGIAHQFAQALRRDLPA